MAKARRERGLTDNDVRERLDVFKRAVEAQKHLGNANAAIVDAMLAFAASPAVKNRGPMSKDEVQRWANRFHDAGKVAIRETKLYQEACRKVPTRFRRR